MVRPFHGGVAFALDPSVPIELGVRLLARQQLCEAIERLDVLAGTAEEPPAEVDVTREIHEIRKRCKEVRAIARLVASSAGRDARTVERTIRDAARRLASSRDAAVLVGTLDGLAAGRELADVAAIRAISADIADGGDHLPEPEVLAATRDDLRRARRRVKRWRLDDGDEVVRRGLAATIRSARRCWIAAHDRDPEPMHSWRTVNKRWWYQVRLVQAAAPDVIDPIVERLDRVGELLGQVHDLDVLLARLELARATRADPDEVERVVGIAGERRAELAEAAMRRAGPLFVESPGHAARRLVGHWRLATATRPTVDRAPAGDASDGVVSGTTVERERKFLLESPPAFDSPGTHLRQGYLAVDGAASVRIRSVDGRVATLTVKVGSGSTRFEFERSIEPDVFDELWPLTEDRRVDKERHVRPFDGHSVEIDVFHDRLAGLVVAEVEFEDDEAMACFEVPEWFGLEVSEDDRYTNARLAIDGRPDA